MSCGFGRQVQKSLFVSRAKGMSPGHPHDTRIAPELEEHPNTQTPVVYRGSIDILIKKCTKPPKTMILLCLFDCGVVVFEILCFTENLCVFSLSAK